MTKREAIAVSRIIDQHSGVVVTGLRVYAGRRPDYAIDCVDTATGYPFVVRSREDWERRAA